MKSSSMRSVIMDLLKSKFSGLALWERIEKDLVLMCVDLPEPNSDANKAEFITKLGGIKDFLRGNNILEVDLKFIDEEVDRYENTKEISLYEEEDDHIDEEIVERYARLGSGTEGVVGIHHPFNYNQLAFLTNGVYKKTGLIKFYISSERTIYGKIGAQFYDHHQKIPVATLVESVKKDPNTGDPLYKKILLFGQKVEGRKHLKLKEIPSLFYVHRFISNDHTEMILLSSEPCEIGDCIVTGVVTQCDDYRMLTDSTKLPTKLPFFFAQQIRSKIIKYKDHEDFKARISQLNISKETYFDYPFTIKRGRISYKTLHPTWYKWLVWSWLTHESKGLFNNYPLHIMTIGEAGSGKSMLLNVLHAKTKEVDNVFSGSSSTLKHLVPSFKYNPAKLGYLAESNRFAFCDEFLRCLIRTKTQSEGSPREESVALMNDLLEHQKREAGSGVSKINVNMTARAFATTNPIRGIHNMEDLVNALDASFLSRWLIYFQSTEHTRIARESKDSDLERYKFLFNENDFVSIMDYLHTFSATYDMDEVEKIYKSVPQILSENLADHYSTRHKHHMECLIDGIVKTRCLFEQDISFEAKPQDYRILKDVWFHIIKSWINPDQIRNIDVSNRIFYLPENCQLIYWKIHEKGEPIHSKAVMDLAMEDMTKNEAYEAIAILIDNEVLVDDGGYLRPHYMVEVKDASQSHFGGL